jgi:hypothetical protein
LSIVYPLDDEQIPSELHRLRKQLHDDIPIIVGGDGIFTYQKSLKEISAVIIEAIPDLVPKINDIRMECALRKNG